MLKRIGKKNIVLLFGILIIISGSYFFVQRISRPKEDIMDPEKIEYLRLKESETIFASKLELCEAHKVIVKHPLTGGDVQKEILGMEGDKCVYTEQLLDGEVLECRYSENERKAMAQYYRDVISIDPDQEVSDIGDSIPNTYSIDGKEVDNPLQEAFERGSCVIRNGQDKPL